ALAHLQIIEAEPQHLLPRSLAHLPRRIDSDYPALRANRPGRGNGGVAGPRCDVEGNLAVARGSQLHQALGPGDKGTQGWALVPFRYQVEAALEAFRVSSCCGRIRHLNSPRWSRSVRPRTSDCGRKNPGNPPRRVRPSTARELDPLGPACSLWRRWGLSWSEWLARVRGRYGTGASCPSCNLAPEVATLSLVTRPPSPCCVDPVGEIAFLASPLFPRRPSSPQPYPRYPTPRAT